MDRTCVALLLICIIICTGTPATSDSITACRNGWLPYEGNCYLFGHTNIPFTEAEHFCKQHTSNMIQLESSPENVFIKDRLRDLKAHCYWIGLTDKATESVWVWSNSNTKPNMTDFYPTEPNGDGDCAVFWPGFDYKWGDYPCAYSVCAAICKTHGPSESTVVGR